MHTTIVKTKDGKTYSGAINKWRPCFNMFTLFGIKHVFTFDECSSIVTPNERISINSPIEGETCDEMLRAYEDVKMGRERGWKETDADGQWKPYPKEKWEWEKRYEQ